MNATKNLAQQERKLLTNLLYHFREIERRRLFCELGYHSIFDYAVKCLGYSEDQAYRRIQAMRALKDVPELAEKLNSGAISLTNLSLAQNTFNKNQKLTKQTFSKAQKLELLSALENKSTRQAEKILAQTMPESFAATKDSVRIKSNEQIEIKMVASEELLEKIEKLKGLLAHSHPHITLAELFAIGCDIAINKFDPGKARKTGAPQKHRGVKSKSSHTARNISVHLKRQIWKGADSKCENCGSVHALEVDHIKAKALGGNNSAQNLRLLCRNCNQRAAIHQVGWQKMNLHIR